jgi:outer membrane lipoprotein-sorting protein
MKKSFFLLLIFLPLFSPARVTAQGDSKAEKILSELSKRSKALQPFHVTFDITTIDLQDKSQNTAHGELILDGKKYVLKNGDAEIYFDGKTLWNYLPDVREVNILLPDPEDNSFLAKPQQLFSDYKERFKFHYVGENQADGKKLWVVDLYPFDLQESYSRIRLQIDQATSLLHSARYFGKNGTHYLVVIRSIEHLKNVTPSLFTFDTKAHPDVEVIDLREDQ